MRLLIDTNIERNAVTHVSVSEEKTVHWGDRSIRLPVLDRRERVPRPDEAFRREQLPYLARTALLARSGTIKLFKSFELQMERFRQSIPNEGYVGFNLLREVPIANVDPPVHRSLGFDGRHKAAGSSRAEQLRFFSSISEPRFVAIRNIFGTAHVADAFHFWTAEVASLDGTLTLDKKFFNIANQMTGKLRSRISVLTPMALCELMNIGPADVSKLARESPPMS